MENPSASDNVHCSLVDTLPSEAELLASMTTLNCPLDAVPTDGIIPAFTRPYAGSSRTDLRLFNHSHWPPQRTDFIDNLGSIGWPRADKQLDPMCGLLGGETENLAGKANFAVAGAGVPLCDSEYASHLFGRASSGLDRAGCNGGMKSSLRPGGGEQLRAHGLNMNVLREINNSLPNWHGPAHRRSDHKHNRTDKDFHSAKMRAGQRYNTMHDDDDTSPTGRCRPCNDLTDTAVKNMLTTLSMKNVTDPAMLLQTLLGFKEEHYKDLMSSISETGTSYVNIFAAYLHNIKVMSADAASPSSKLAGTLARAVIKQYHKVFKQTGKTGPSTAHDSFLARGGIPGFTSRSPPAKYSTNSKFAGSNGHTNGTGNNGGSGGHRTGSYRNRGRRPVHGTNSVKLDRSISSSVDIVRGKVGVNRVQQGGQRGVGGGRYGRKGVQNSRIWERKNDMKGGGVGPNLLGGEAGNNGQIAYFHSQTVDNNRSGYGIDLGQLINTGGFIDQHNAGRDGCYQHLAACIHQKKSDFGGGAADIRSNMFGSGVQGGNVIFNIDNSDDMGQENTSGVPNKAGCLSQAWRVDDQLDASKMIRF